MPTEHESKLDLGIFGVRPMDPGFVYVLENQGRFKVGRTTDRATRLKDARTWLPDMNVIGIKPFWNHRQIERSLHQGFAHCWYAGEWFEMLDDDYRRVLVEGFEAFSDTDRDRNSADFIYWMNSDGMSEMVIERSRLGVSVGRFLKDVSSVRRRE